MKFLELVTKRFSTRKYSDQSIGRDLLERCLEASRLAPSASNSQPWHFVVVDDPELKNKVAEETYSKLVSFNKFVQHAGAIVVIVLEKPGLVTQIGGKIKNKEYALIDLGIAAEHFCLQAAEEDLGTCMLGWFNEKPIKKILGIPRSKTIGLIISVGYSNHEKVPSKKRKQVQEMASFNAYSKG